MSIITCRSHRSRAGPDQREARSNDAEYNYIGSSSGPWRVTNVFTICGTPLRVASHVSVNQGPLDRIPFGTSWVLSGIVSKSRYIAREEQDSVGFGVKPQSGMMPTRAALISVRKTRDWWKVEREGRRDIVEGRRKFVASAIGYLPSKLRHLGKSCGIGEKLDFVTWFEYAPHDVAVFDEMLAALRASEEWRYVEREIDIRLELTSQT